MDARRNAGAGAGAGALIFGWAAYIALMAVHPSHVGGPALGHLDLNDAVHWTALMLTPLLAFGYIGMASHLGLSRPLPLLGLCVMLFSLLAGMSAGIMSGLVMPEVLRSGREAESPPEIIEGLRHMSWWINQGFSAVHYTLAALGTGVFGLAWLQRREHRALGVAGVVVAAGFLAWLATGLWRPDLHGALVVVVVVGAWTISAGFAMRGAARES